jgi:hypothetical protein
MSNIRAINGQELQRKTGHRDLDILLTAVSYCIFFVSFAVTIPVQIAGSAIGIAYKASKKSYIAIDSWNQNNKYNRVKTGIVDVLESMKEKGEIKQLMSDELSSFTHSNELKDTVIDVVASYAQDIKSEVLALTQSQATETEAKLQEIEAKVGEQHAQPAVDVESIKAEIRAEYQDRESDAKVQDKNQMYSAIDADTQARITSVKFNTQKQEAIQTADLYNKRLVALRQIEIDLGGKFNSSAVAKALRVNNIEAKKIIADLIAKSYIRHVDTVNGKKLYKNIM